MRTGTICILAAQSTESFLKTNVECSAVNKNRINQPPNNYNLEIYVIAANSAEVPVL